MMASRLPDNSMRRVVARYIWIRHDADEDGIAELQFVLRVGNEVIEHMPVSTVPVCLYRAVYEHAQAHR